MIAGIIAGVTWAIETIVLGIALSMTPFVETEQAMVLAPFVSTFLHDFFSAIWSLIYNLVKGNIVKVFKAVCTKSGRFVAVAAIIGGPVGMTGYVLTVANMGASIGAVASAIFPAIGAVLAYLFLKEKMAWYRWIFLLLSLIGVYGLSYSPELNIKNFLFGIIGTLMCSFGWGIEAVIIAKCVKDEAITNEYALFIRQMTSALVYGIVLLPLIKGWRFTVSLIIHTSYVIPIIVIASLFATVSYLFYYKSISEIGASKAMALNITYSAWAVVISIIFLNNYSLMNPTTITCTIVVLVFSILSAADYKELIK
ncbi:MAG: DMT family transporter [Lachnospiraceae bacterium]|nr:DMT family transporter [Lachnospiraceae bacterium]